MSLDIFNDEDKILMLSALSKGYFDIKKIELGFDCLNKSNLIKKERSNFSLEKEKLQFENIKNFFFNIDNNNIKYKNNLKSLPIFIIGMPRSGTSLIEQILSSHSDIYGAGELNFLQKAIEIVGLEKPNNINEYFYQIRKSYYEQFNKISQSKLIIDKLPINFKWTGFIIKSFPEAKIIHIERNPMAVCWSNYKTHFVDRGMDFNLSQEGIAIYYKLYAELMKFWKKKFSKNFLNIKYESFVKDYEENTKKILDYLDLKWEKQMKNYQKTDRVVTTASYQQVRNKIRKNTSNEWKKYGSYLSKMQETLTREKIKF